MRRDELAVAKGAAALVHVQHIYDKLGVSTRAAAAVFAMEQHLI